MKNRLLPDFGSFGILGESLQRLFAKAKRLAGSELQRSCEHDAPAAYKVEHLRERKRFTLPTHKRRCAAVKIGEHQDIA